MKKKFLFIGDIDSINLELVHKSHRLLKNKVQYILLGNIHDVYKYLNKLQSKLNINEIITDTIKSRVAIKLIANIKISRDIDLINNS